MIILYWLIVGLNEQVLVSNVIEEKKNLFRVFFTSLSSVFI